MNDFFSIREDSCDVLREADIWGVAGPDVWKATRFEGDCEFYPVYRDGDYYSYSPLALMLRKGTFRKNNKVARKVMKPGFRYLSSSGTIDQDVRRLGRPMVPDLTLTSRDEFIRRIAQAIMDDVRSAEELNPSYTNVILCGGVDSLNLLLLPWKNPVLVASGAPNDTLVRQFLIDNRLDYELVSLDDSDSSLLDEEILINSCRNDLAHCRWSPHLRRISSELSGQVIFWKGQLADVFMTLKWHTYAHPRSLESVIEHIPSAIRDGLNATYARQRLIRNALFWRGAMWQGAHMSILRQLTGGQVLSAYHGPAVSDVRNRVDLRTAVRGDIRCEVGELIAGGSVNYPTENPGPPPTEFRKNRSHLDPFLARLDRIDIDVISG